MKTKEEILKSQFIDGEYDEIMGYLNTDITPSITEAMQEYADEFSILFLKWCKKQPHYKFKSYTEIELLRNFKDEK